MSYPRPTLTTPIDLTPVQTIEERDGWYYRTIVLAQPGYVVPQHVHDHDHETRVESGAARGWQDGAWIGDKAAGESFHIPAHRAHLFQALHPDTRLTCVHNIESALSLKRKGI